MEQPNFKNWKYFSTFHQRIEIAWREGNSLAVDDQIAEVQVSHQRVEVHLANRTSEALEAIREPEALVERFEERWWCAELHRLRGVFLATIGADETRVEASFCEAIRTTKQQ